MRVQDFQVWDKSRGAVNNLLVVFLSVWVLSILPILEDFLHVYFAFHPLPAGIVKPWGFFTYMFVHLSFFHLLSNALWLYFVGILLQDLVGDKVLLRLFFWGGFFGAFFYQLFYTFWLGLDSQQYYGGLIGASGGVSAVVVGTAIFSPKYRVFLFGIIEVELRWIALIKVLLDISGALGDVNRGGFICHLGGIFFAGIYVYGYLKGNMPGWVDEMLLSFENIFGKGNRVRKSPKSGHKKSKSFDLQELFSSSTVGAGADKSGAGKASRNKTKGSGNFENEEEINRILDKIAQVGYQNLTEEEREILFKASKE
jgi:membrane associated rhomboid family serine protease